MTSGRRLHPLTLYEAALDGVTTVAVDPSGVRTLAVALWSADPDPVDEVILARCRPPVLDVGCGPGRLVGALAGRGVPALGIDVSARAVERTRARGAPALRRAVEGRLPAEGRWGTVLLVDGNIGIGGDPAALLRRCRELLAPDGVLLVEVDPDPGVDVLTTVELRTADGRASRPLPWAYVGARALVALAARCDLVVGETWRLRGRTVVALHRAPPPRSAELTDVVGPPGVPPTR